ncbi:MAG: ATP-binding protein [Geminicoccaceae bacterium]
MTSIQLWFDYEASISSIHESFSRVETSYSSSLTASLWTYDHALVQSQLDGIANLSEIEWARIVAEDGSSWTAGERQSTYTLVEHLPLIHWAGAEDATTLGQLTLTSSIDTLYWSLVWKFAVILFLNLIKTLCMSFVIIYLFHQIIGRHLIDLASYLKLLRLSERSTAFHLRRCRNRLTDDELDQLVDAINVMRTNINSSYDAITQYQDGLETSLRKERELSGLQRQFVSMVSHEFRTPLAIIDGNAQRLQRRKSDLTEEKLDGVLNKIRTSVLRLTDLMESILNSSRLEDGKIKCESAECDITGLLDEICNAYRDLNTGHRIITEIRGLPPTISADEKLLRQIFSNLVSNAVKYAPDDTSVWVTAHCSSQDEVVVSVRDQGVGIPEQELNQLFQRFFRASTSTGIPGTGIGLHLVKHLVEMHGGRIEVESSPGEGATFSVHLPVNHPLVWQPNTDQTEIGDGFDPIPATNAAS